MIDDRPSVWLPPGKKAAVCFSIDDVHPASSAHGYDAGGDLGRGALGHLEWLLSRHPYLAATLFTTPDWRELSPMISRHLLAHIPVLRKHLYLSRRWPKGTMRLDRHPDFARYLSSLPRTEVALHGLHHVHRGPRIPVEFQQEKRAQCTSILREGMAIFERAGFSRPSGMTPPGFDASQDLIDAMVDLGFAYISSARDIRTAIVRDVKANMSGLRGVSLLYPELLQSGLVHIPVNFQATSVPDRAYAILDLGGILHIKAHIIKNLGVIALDGLDELYRNYLDLLFASLHQRYGASLWWGTMKQLTEAVLDGRRGHERPERA